MVKYLNFVHTAYFCERKDQKLIFSNKAGTPVIQSGGQLFRVHSAGQNRLVSLGPNSANRVMVSRPTSGAQQVLINKSIQPIQQTVILEPILTFVKTAF